MLTSLILKLSVPGYGKKLTAQSRARCGIVSGITGIVCNLLLIIIKLVLAIISGSIAMATDAVNNISDAGSGIITVIGFHISSQPPDAEHPFGHGRTEYIAGLAVALLIASLGITFLKDSIVSLFKPSKISADNLTIIIFSATILIKCWMFFFYRKVGNLISSDVVKAAAYDSLSDCIGTFVVVLSLFFSRYTDFPLDGCAGILVALMILWAGAGVLKDTFNKLLGQPPDRDLVEKVKTTILACPGIDGIHDMMIHNYGENSYFVTAHAEISCQGDRVSAHDILENAEVTVGQKLSVNLLLHGDPYDLDNPEVIFWRSRMENAVCELDKELKLYDFRLEKSAANTVQKLAFHLLIPHKYEIAEDLVKELLQKKIRVYQPDMQLDIRFVKSFV